MTKSLSLLLLLYEQGSQTSVYLISDVRVGERMALLPVGPLWIFETRPLTLPSLSNRFADCISAELPL